MSSDVAAQQPASEDADSDSDVDSDASGRDSVDRAAPVAAAADASDTSDDQLLRVKDVAEDDIEAEVRQGVSRGAIQRIVRLSSSERHEQQQEQQQQQQQQQQLTADAASDVSSSSASAVADDAAAAGLQQLQLLEAEEEEETLTDDWRVAERHVFIMSRSGKPIFSRHGNEEKLVTHMGVMTALASVVEDMGDELQNFVSADRRFVFLIKDYLMLVCVSSASESSSQLLLQLNYLYNQILSLLTYTVLKKVFRKSNYDLRHLLPDCDRILNSLVLFMETDIGPLLGAVQCLPLPKAVRESVGQAVTTGARVRDLVFGILLSGTKLVSLVHMKKQYLHPLDMHVIINLISSTESFKTSESWTPICLPKFDASGNLYAYVCFIDAELCLVLLTVDNTSFELLSEAKAKIVEKLQKHNCIAQIRDSAAAGHWSLAQTGTEDMRHFVYKIRSAGQYFSPLVAQPFDGEDGRRQLMALYQRMHCLLHRRSRPLKLVYHTNRMASVMGWVTPEFELYAAFSPLIGKRAAIQSVNRSLKWLTKERDRLFCLSSPTF